MHFQNPKFNNDFRRRHLTTSLLDTHAGDTRQTPPIVRRGGRPEIFDATLKQSQLWNQFDVHTFFRNERLLRGGTSPAREQHAEWLLQLGNNEAPEPHLPESCRQSGGKRVLIPPHLKVSTEEALLQHVYSDETLLEAKADPQRYFTQRALMASLNSTVQRLNTIMTKKWKETCPDLVRLTTVAFTNFILESIVSLPMLPKLKQCLLRFYIFI